MKVSAFFRELYGPMAATWESLGVTPAARRMPGLTPREVVFCERVRLCTALSQLIGSGAIQVPVGQRVVVLPDGYIFQGVA